LNRAANYKTKQLEAVLNYVVSHKNTHVTAAQIAEFFEKGENRIGRTTVFRSLDKLTESGKVRRYITDGTSGACYQYAEDENCHSHFHLKCEDCGKLLHLECDKLNGLENHISSSHAFRINMMKTVFYGTCGNCSIKACT
jgi:Fur family ferric uptake transcriptional regulator